MSIRFSKKKVVRIVLFVFFLIPLLAILLLGYYEYNRIEPSNVMFSNITSNSVTISWSTSEPISSSVIINESDTFLPLLLPLGKERYFDTRDVMKAELEAAPSYFERNEGLVIADYSRELTITERGEYYTHHVVVTGLESNAEYSLFVGDNYLFRRAEDIDGIGLVSTLQVPEDIRTPVPAYGSVRDADGLDIDFDDMYVVSDGLVYLNYFDTITEKRSNVLSGVLGREGTWYLDISGAVDDEGNPFLQTYDTVEENIIIEMIIDAGPLGLWRKTDYAYWVTPMSETVLNMVNSVYDGNVVGSVFEIEGMNERLSIETFVEEEEVLGVVLSAGTECYNIGQIQRIGDSCYLCEIVGGQFTVSRLVPTDCPSSEDASYCGEIECIAGSYCEIGPEGVYTGCTDEKNDFPAQQCDKLLTYCGDCYRKIGTWASGDFRYQKCEQSMCIKPDYCSPEAPDITEDPEQETRTCAGGGRYGHDCTVVNGVCRYCGWGPVGGNSYGPRWVDAPTKYSYCEGYSNQSIFLCNKPDPEEEEENGETNCGELSFTHFSDEVTDWPNRNFCKEGSPDPLEPTFPSSGGIVTWRCGSSPCSASKEKEESEGAEEPEGAEELLAFCSYGAEGKRCVYSPTFRDSFFGDDSTEASIGVCSQTLLPRSVFFNPVVDIRCVRPGSICNIPTLSEHGGIVGRWSADGDCVLEAFDIDPDRMRHTCMSSYHNFISSDGERTFRCSRGNWKSVEGGFWRPHARDCQEFVKTEGDVNKCSGSTICYDEQRGKSYSCREGGRFYEILDNVDRTITEISATNITRIDIGVPCEEGREECFCNEGVDVRVSGGEYCREVTTYTTVATIYGAEDVSDICHSSQEGQICNHEGNRCERDGDYLRCIGSNEDLSHSPSGVRKESVYVKGIQGRDNESSSTKYLIDHSSGLFLNIPIGLYTFTYNGESYSFINDGISEGIFLYIDKNDNGKYDEGVDIKVSDIASEIEIYPVEQSYNYYLNEGYNFVSFPFLIRSEEKHTAGAFLKVINELYDDVLFSVSKYNSGQWQTVGQNIELYSSNDFPLLPGEGYVIKAKASVLINIVGHPIKFSSPSDKAPINLQEGWNLIGLYGTNVKRYTAKSLLNDVNSSNFTADNVTRWEVGRQMYGGLQLSEGQEYGSDFPINRLESIFVRIKSGRGNWNPQLEN